MMLVRKVARRFGGVFSEGSFFRARSGLVAKGIHLSTLFKFQLWDCVFFDLTLNEKSDI